MQKVLHQKATVQPGGKVEVVSPELEAGQTVDVVVLHESSVQGRSIMEILDSGPAPPVSDGRGGEGISGGREGVVGPLTLPLTGLIYIDASGLIYSMERVEPYRTLLEPM